MTLGYRLGVACWLMAVPAFAQTTTTPAPVPPAQTAPPATLPHGFFPPPPESTKALQSAIDKMRESMEVIFTANADADFVAAMIPYHQGAIDLAQAELKYGHDPKIRDWAAHIIATHTSDIAMLRQWQQDAAKKTK